MLGSAAGSDDGAGSADSVCAAERVMNRATSRRIALRRDQREEVLIVSGGKRSLRKRVKMPKASTRKRKQKTVSPGDG